MTEKMYKLNRKKYGSCPYSNETLAEMIRLGDDDMAIRWLLSECENYLQNIARTICSEQELKNMGDDLKQVGAMALIEAAKKFRPTPEGEVDENGKKKKKVTLKTYAYKKVKSKMIDRKNEVSGLMQMPVSRYRQLKIVGFLRATMKDKTEEELISAIQVRLEVSEKVARELLLDYRDFFRGRNLGDKVGQVAHEADPARLLERRMQMKCVRKALKELKWREAMLIQFHLGLRLPEEEEQEVLNDPEKRDWLTFEELAVRLNYNDHSAAEKAYHRAIRKLKKMVEDGDYPVWEGAMDALQEVCEHPQSLPSKDGPMIWYPPDCWRAAERLLEYLRVLIELHSIFSETLAEEAQEPAG